MVLEAVDGGEPVDLSSLPPPPGLCELYKETIITRHESNSPFGQEVPLLSKTDGSVLAPAWIRAVRIQKIM